MFIKCDHSSQAIDSRTFEDMFENISIMNQSFLSQFCMLLTQFDVWMRSHCLLRMPKTITEKNKPVKFVATSKFFRLEADIRRQDIEKDQKL